MTPIISRKGTGTCPLCGQNMRTTATHSYACRVSMQQYAQMHQQPYGVPLVGHCGRWWPIPTLPATCGACGAVVLEEGV